MCRTRRMLGIPARLHHAPRAAQDSHNAQQQKGLDARSLPPAPLPRAQCASIQIDPEPPHADALYNNAHNSRQNPYNSLLVRTSPHQSHTTLLLPRTHSPPRAAGDRVLLGLYLLDGKRRKLVLWCALALVPSRPPRGCVALFRLSSTYRFTADACLPRRAANSSTRNACVTLT